eukprot:TRINITY_DN1735_c1_g2_i1.p1 TRINITY_DN1735_c1_g2~~TRINITY_DN1735_c1_g2_i1.p1  ORF type:complete len:360 (+),score=52.92 TRINITY_DN1735_c1_g2_i1:70-1080(+)
MITSLCYAFIFLVQFAHTRTILIQDAGIEDYMCTILLTNHSADFDGEVVVNADSTLPASMIAADKLHQIIPNGEKVHLSLSRARMFNAFPYIYRLDTEKFLNLSEMQDVPSRVQWPYENGDVWLLNYLKTNVDVTIVITTAPTPLTNVLSINPELAANIKRIVWMGGAVNVPGNLDPAQFPWNNTVAEWNIFTDPAAAADLFAMMGAHSVPILLFPLDIANLTPLDSNFYKALQNAVDQSPPSALKLHQLVLDAYLLVKNDTFYRLWDTLAAGYVIWPELYAPPARTLLEVVVGPTKMGALRKCSAPSDTCFPIEVFSSFVNEAARETFVTNVASG